MRFERFTIGLSGDSEVPSVPPEVNMFIADVALNCVGPASRFNSLSLDLSSIYVKGGCLAICVVVRRYCY